MPLSYINIEPSQKYHGGALLMAILIILSMWPWFYVFYQPSATNAFLMNIGIALLAFLLTHDSYVFSRGVLIFFIFLIAAFWGTTGNTNAFMGTFLSSIPFFFFLCSNEQYQCAIIRIFNKLFSWIIVVSLIFWSLNLIGVSMRHTLLNNDMYSFENYYFFLKSVHNIEKNTFPRFSSIFLEPGYVACIMVFMMFLDNYNFKKWQNIVYLIALFFTFSLAGWLFFFISFIPFLSSKGRLRWFYLGGMSVFLIAFVYMNYYAQGDNVVKEKVGTRIEIEDGEMTGYNRTNDNLNYYWENKLVPEGKLLMGVRDDYKVKYDFMAAVELRAYIVRYGLIAALLYMLFMFVCYRNNRSRYGFWYAIVAFLFVFRGYSIMFTYFFLFIYVGGLVILKMNALNLIERDNEFDAWNPHELEIDE